MKKWLAILLSSVALFTVTACSNGNSTPAPSNNSPNTVSPQDTSQSSEEPEVQQSTPADSDVVIDSDENETNKALIVYFSWSGNTEAVATEIQNQTGADIFEIVPEQPYTDDYNTLLDVAKEEQRNKARPAISGSLDNLEDYDVIFLGFPNWWADMPMILYSFLDEYDLSGKTIAPFCTSGGSGFSATISTLKSMEPDAEVLDGLHLGSSASKNPESAVTEWLNGLGLNE